MIKSQFNSWKLRFSSMIFIVVKPEHMETCKLPVVPVLLEIIVMRLLCGKLLLLLVLFGWKAGWQSRHENRNMEKLSRWRGGGGGGGGEPCILILAEKENWPDTAMKYILLQLPHMLKKEHLCQKRRIYHIASYFSRPATLWMIIRL